MATKKSNKTAGRGRSAQTGSGGGSQPRSRSTGKRATSQTRASSGSKSETRKIAVRSKMTTDHDEIRRWAENRGGRPACVRGTGSRQDTGMLRIDFPDGAEPGLQEISWDEWFDKFEEKSLLLVYQDKTASGRPSRFNKLVSREAAQERASGRRRSTPKTRTAGG